MASSEKSTVFSRTLVREKVKILPREIGSNIRDVIMAKLVIMLEGKCTRHGYVRPGSIKIHELSSGRIEGSSLNGDIIYHASVVADVCNPVPGHVVPARIVNSNKFGLLAHSGIEINGRYTTIMEIVITRHNYHGGTTDVPVDSVRVGDDVFVEVLGKTFELGDAKIAIAGRLLRAVGGGSGSSGSSGNKRTLVSTAVVNPDLNASDSDDDVSVDVPLEDMEGAEGADGAEGNEGEEDEEDEEEEDKEDDEDKDVSEEAEDEGEVDDEVDDDFSLTADDDDFSEAGLK